MSGSPYPSSAPFRSSALLFFLLTTAVVAQPDTTAAPVLVFADTTADALPERIVSPGGALRRSLLVPGWGQLYNRDFVKIPVVVGGLGGLVTLAVVLNQRTVRYRRAAIYADGEQELDALPDPGNAHPEFVDAWLAAGGLSAPANRALRDANRRNRDLLVLLSALAYGLQALDAYVSAELADFDVSEDLSLRLVPTPTGPAAALRWSF